MSDQVDIVELKETDCDFGTCYQPVVETPNGGIYQYTGTMQLTEETGRDQVENFDPEGRKWKHVSGPEYTLPTDDETDTGDVVDFPQSDWGNDEIGIVEIDRTWKKGDKRRVTVEERDGLLGDEVVDWSRVDKLEGDTVEINDELFEIDGFGKSWGRHGDRQRYMYVRVNRGSDIVDMDDYRESTGTTGPGGCPVCGGPTSVSGEPCSGSCRSRR